jgi:hypothetical protein
MESGEATFGDVGFGDVVKPQVMSAMNAAAVATQIADHDEPVVVSSVVAVVSSVLRSATGRHRLPNAAT